MLKLFGGCRQVRVDLGLTSPQAQWLSRGGSSMSAQGSEAGSADPAGLGLLDSPFKHRSACHPI